MVDLSLDFGRSTGVHNIRVADNTGHELRFQIERSAGGFLLELLRWVDFLLWETPVAHWRIVGGVFEDQGQLSRFEDGMAVLWPKDRDEFQIGIIDASETIMAEAPPHTSGETFEVADFEQLQATMPPEEPLPTGVYLDTIVSVASSYQQGFEHFEIAENHRYQLPRYFEDARAARAYFEEHGTLDGFTYERSFEEIDDYISSTWDIDTRMRSLLTLDRRVEGYIDTLADREEPWVEQRFVDLLTRDDPISEVAVEYLRDNHYQIAKFGLYNMLWIDSTDQTPIALRALAQLDDDSVVGEITNSLRDSRHAVVRRTAAEVLGELKPSSAREDLEAAADSDSDPEVREAAETALGALENGE